MDKPRKPNSPRNPGPARPDKGGGKSRAAKPEGAKPRTAKSDGAKPRPTGAEGAKPRAGKAGFGKTGTTRDDGGQSGRAKASFGKPRSARADGDTPRPARTEGGKRTGPAGKKETGKKDTGKKDAGKAHAPKAAPKATPRPAPGRTAPERIAKVIARSGRASRREAERLIELGRVTVNGEVIARAALNVTASDRIEVDGIPLTAPEEPRLWLYHKRPGLVTTARDEQGRPTIYDDLPGDMPRVMPVGRLDLNSEGLLLLTNDGGVKRQLELPSTGWLRRYRVRVNGRPTEDTVQPLRDGLVIDGEAFQPMQVSLDRQQGANAWLTVGLREGKNREVRRAMADVGLTVNRLIRVSYGPFQLGQIKPGATEEVRRRILRDQLGLDDAKPQDRTATRQRKPRPPRGSGGPRK